jgi:hypothetical protein
MAEWNELLARVNSRRASVDVAVHLASLAHFLLNRTSLVIASIPHRLTEVEVYFHSDRHPDPYPHRHPAQTGVNRWYFHQTGKGFRGGSYKGVDVTIGEGKAIGGILFRGLEKPDGTLIDGPSLQVDHWLRLTGEKKVADLYRRISPLDTWDQDNLVHLKAEAEDRDLEIFSSARVGLPWRPFDPLRLEYLTKPYRFLTEPKRIRKGKGATILGLIREKQDDDTIHRLTGSPRRSIARFREGYRTGFGLEHPDLLSWKLPLDSYGLSLLHGFVDQNNT